MEFSLQFVDGLRKWNLRTIHSRISVHSSVLPVLVLVLVLVAPSSSPSLKWACERLVVGTVPRTTSFDPMPATRVGPELPACGRMCCLLPAIAGEAAQEQGRRDRPTVHHVGEEGCGRRRRLRARRRSQDASVPGPAGLLQAAEPCGGPGRADGGRSCGPRKSVVSAPRGAQRTNSARALGCDQEATRIARAGDPQENSTCSTSRSCSRYTQRSRSRWGSTRRTWRP